MFDFIKNISPIELAVIGLILIIFFGSRVVTGLAKTSGASLKEIKKVKKTFTEALEDDEKPAKVKKEASV